MLWDTTLQSYVSVIGLSLIKELFSEEIGRELEEFCASRIPMSAELLRPLRPHYISYRCVGCEGGLLPVIVLDYLCLERVMYKRWLRIRQSQLTGPVVLLSGAIR